MKLHYASQQWVPASSTVFVDFHTNLLRDIFEFTEIWTILELSTCQYLWPAATNSSGSPRQSPYKTLWNSMISNFLCRSSFSIPPWIVLKANKYFSIWYPTLLTYRDTNNSLDFILFVWQRTKYLREFFWPRSRIIIVSLKINETKWCCSFQENLFNIF